MKFFLILAALFIFSCATVKDKDIENNIDTQETIKAEPKTIQETPDAKTSQDSFQKTTCSLDNDVRTITTVPSNPSGCTVSYTKDNISKTIASAMNDTSICDEVVSKVKGNLEKVGFTCK